MSNAALALSSKHVAHLRGLAHKLNPMVQMGKVGLSPVLLKEIDRCLEDHELIKVRISAADRAALETLTADIAEQNRAALIQVIGHIAVFYRPKPAPDTKIKLA